MAVTRILTAEGYNKLHHFNFANNKNFWVPYKTNPKGPKKIWVPKSPPCVFYVGEGSHKTWEIWCLDGGCTWTKRTHIWSTAIKEVLVGKTTMLGALELVTISKLLLFMYMLFSYMIFIACSCFVFLCASCGKNMLRCSFYQNLYYSYTNSELHLIYIYLHFMLICTHYMHMYRLVLMILSFIHALPNFMILLHVYVFLIQI